jgi:TRAP-type C4-dicarboxylate transport system substrate-binding protein
MIVRERAGAAGAGAAVLFGLLAATLGARAADDKPYVMKISLATLNDVPHQYAKNLAAAVERDSGGRIKPEIYTSSQLGSVQRQIEGVQFGAIQMTVLPPEFYAGVDERFEVLTAPGLVKSMAEGQRLAANPKVRDLMLGLGADKGLHGVALFMATQSSLIAKAAIRRLAELKGRKIRIFGSEFQGVAMRRLGAVPKPMTLGDVLPALQDNVIDGAVASVAIFNAMHFGEVARYVTETGQPATFVTVEISKKWYDSLPADLQRVIDRAGAAESIAINPQTIDINERARRAWTASGGELISLPTDEQSLMLKILAGVGDEVSNAKPLLTAAYKIVTDAAERGQ